MTDNLNLRIYRNEGQTSHSYLCRIRMGDYKRPQPFDKAEFVSRFEAWLPLPNELRDDTRAEFNTPSLETVGDILNTAGASIPLGIALRKSGDVLSGIAGAALGGRGDLVSQSVGDAVQQQTQQILDPASITSAVQQFTGVAPNPNQTVAFQGPALRDHNFTWTFFPHDDVESRNIQALISELKARSLPTSTMSDQAGILNYPQMAIINFYPWDSRGDAQPPGNPYGWTTQSIIKIKKCFISNVGVNYSPSGQAAFFQGDNRPVAVQLSVSLKEIEYMLGEDYGRGSGYTGALANFLENPIKSIYDFGAGTLREGVESAAAGLTSLGLGGTATTDGTTTNPVAEGEL